MDSLDAGNRQAVHRRAKRATLGTGARTIPAMVKMIYAEVPEKLHAMVGQSVYSHLKKLLEGRVSEETIPNAPRPRGSRAAEPDVEPGLWSRRSISVR